MTIKTLKIIIGVFIKGNFPQVHQQSATCNISQSPHGLFAHIVVGGGEEFDKVGHGPSLHHTLGLVTGP